MYSDVESQGSTDETYKIKNLLTKVTQAAIWRKARRSQEWEGGQGRMLWQSSRNKQLWQTFSAKGQMVNISSIAGHTDFATTTPHVPVVQK